MAFDWRDFLVVAHEQRNDQREGIQRTSLGRAYYYVYNLGLTKATTQNFSMRRGQGGSHRQLWDWFQKHSDMTIRQMGVEANRMYSNRISADYNDAPIPTAAYEVKLQLRRAQKFETLMAQINGQQPPTPLAP
jgi:hypothetical protein